MDQKNEQKAPLRIKNMAELKRCIRPGTELVATSHSKHPALVGLVRVVTEVQTNAYYSVVKDQPSHQYSTCNYGKGFRSDFEKASNYLFEGTTIKVLDRRSSDGSVLYEMELYPGEYLVLGQKNDMEENADIREDNGEIKQEGMNMTLYGYETHAGKAGCDYVRHIYGQVCAVRAAEAVEGVFLLQGREHHRLHGQPDEQHPVPQPVR